MLPVIAVGKKEIIFVVQYLQYLTLDRNLNLKTEDVKKSLNKKIMFMSIIFSFNDFLTSSVLRLKFLSTVKYCKYCRTKIFFFLPTAVTGSNCLIAICLH